MSLILLYALGCPSEQQLGVYDSEPTVSITSPLDGSTWPDDAALTLVGEVHDRETALEELKVSWASNVDGVLTDAAEPTGGGVVEFPVAGLSVGPHTLSLIAIDSAGQKAVANVTITIEDVPDAPWISIVHPAVGDPARDDAPFTFTATVGDNQDALETLAVTVSSAESGEVCTMMADSAGLATCEGTLYATTHHLTFTVTDPGGLSATAEAGLEVDSHLDIDDDGDGWTENQGDCDDARPLAFPGGTETFDSTDEDCDGTADNGTDNFDDDGDGFSETDGDCDDADATSYPEGTEVIDGADTDCDGVLENDTDVYDDDGDGWSESIGDCDDGDPSAYPYASELEDGVDNDCDTIVDEGTNAYDDDGDGYSENAGDCDDTDSDTWPGAPEDTSDGVDQDCNGIVELDADGDGFISIATGGDDCDDTDDDTWPGIATNEGDPTLCRTDADGDGWGDDTPATDVEAGSDCEDADDTVNPTATEECDSVDNDCDGSVDEANATGCDDYYYDYDGDLYGSTVSQCLCSPSGYYTASVSTDCYDLNTQASPGATSYRATDRGDGSFDYNCDGVEDTRYSSTGVCSIYSLCAVSKGWSGSVEACGDSGSYISACAFNVSTLNCSATTSSTTQTCR